MWRLKFLVCFICWMIVATHAAAVEPLRIAVIASLSGPFALVGEWTVSQVRGAADLVNAKGGLFDGRKIEIVALDGKANLSFWARLGELAQAHRELRDDVLEAHVGPIDVVRPKDQRALEMLAAVVDHHHLADDLAGAVGEPRIVRIGHDERRVFGGRDMRRRLVCLLYTSPSPRD